MLEYGRTWTKKAKEFDLAGRSMRNSWFLPPCWQVGWFDFHKHPVFNQSKVYSSWEWLFFFNAFLSTFGGLKLTFCTRLDHFDSYFSGWSFTYLLPPQDAGPLRKQVVDAAKLLRCFGDKKKRKIGKRQIISRVIFHSVLGTFDENPILVVFWVLLESCDSSTVFIGTLEVFSCSVQWCDLALNGQKVVSRVWVRMDLQEMDGSSHLHAVWNWHVDV